MPVASPTALERAETGSKLRTGDERVDPTTGAELGRAEASVGDGANWMNALELAEAVSPGQRDPDDWGLPSRIAFFIPDLASRR